MNSEAENKVKDEIVDKAPHLPKTFKRGDYHTLKDLKEYLLLNLIR